MCFFCVLFLSLAPYKFKIVNALLNDTVNEVFVEKEGWFSSDKDANRLRPIPELIL